MRVTTNSWTAAAAVALAMLSVSAGAADFRGVTREMQQKLAHATTFVCDGGKSFPVARLNDNYCDCADGSDEPGTAACSHTAARFYCVNAGHYAKHLPTSRVNDHICDCCDGSDEYASGAACPITCSSLMEASLTEKRGLLDVYEQGAAVRATLIANASKLFEQDTQELVEHEAELDLLKRSVSQFEKIKDEEELVETKEKMENAKDLKREMVRALGLDALSPEQLGFLVLELANTVASKDDVLRLVKAERDGKGDSPLETDEAAWKLRDEARDAEIKRLVELRAEREKRKTENEKVRQEAIDRGETPVDEPTTEPEPMLEDPPMEDRPVKLLFDKMATFSAYEREQAKTARTNYYEASSKFSTMERTVNDLKNTLAKDYGDQNILYALRDTCVETSGGQYTYKACFFGQAKQDHTSLGDMQTLDTPNEVYFSGGATCWNGPARSLRVTLECGVNVELYGVDEPSTCVYTAKLTTPVACDESHKTRLLAGDDGDKNFQPHTIEVTIDATL